jgi:hypothetical protein
MMESEAQSISVMYRMRTYSIQPADQSISHSIMSVLLGGQNEAQPLEPDPNSNRLGCRL